MSPITLEDFEQEALPTLFQYATMAALSPAYDANWQSNSHIHAAAHLFADWARERDLANFSVEVHEIENLTPVITVTVEATAPTSGTVVLYGHLDKQPPLGTWSDGLGPYSPVRRGDRVYARGLADDGYAMFASLLALEDLEARGIAHARCVVLIEASEESGSPDLAAHLDQLADVLGDVELLICLDSGALTYDRLWVTTSLRGNLIAELTVQVLEQGQHSGSASGVVPSSFRIARQLLDRLEDSSTGRIQLFELFGDIPLAHREAARAVTDEFGDVAGDEQPVVAGLELMGANPAERLLQRTWWPTLSVTGVGGIPSVADAGNVLRASTTLVLSLRLPPNVDGAFAEEALRRALTTNVPSHARVSLRTESANGWLSPELSPWLARALEEASEFAFGKPAAYAGEGGTIPFLAVLGARYPKVQFVATGVLGPHSNAHGIDEMLDLPTVVAVTNAVTHIIGAHADATSIVAP
jgi:acetylornithine deacetylase/succinyl-diaminopimelate desuccinylase-like protein